MSNKAEMREALRHMVHRFLFQAQCALNVLSKTFAHTRLRQEDSQLSRIPILITEERLQRFYACNNFCFIRIIKDPVTKNILDAEYDPENRSSITFGDRITSERFLIITNVARSVLLPGLGY